MPSLFDRKSIFAAPIPTKKDKVEMHSFEIKGTSFKLPCKYKPIKSIGTGAYGVVISATDESTSKKVAIKKITNAFDDEVDAKRILREIKLLRHFDHENIIKIVDILEPPSETARTFQDIYIVADLMETDLHRIIYSKQSLREEHFQYFVFQILKAIHYMHSANVLHRDLKPANILVNSNCDLRICDFGLARGVLPDEEENNVNLTQYVVTRWYRAPELLLSNNNYTKAIDVWSVGCIFGELLGRKPLFAGKDYAHQLQLIIKVVGSQSEEELAFVHSAKAKAYVQRHIRPCSKMPFSSIYPAASNEALDLLEKMLIFNPNKRISVKEALEHPFFAAYHEEICPEANSLFKFEFEDGRRELTSDVIREYVYMEAVSFHNHQAVVSQETSYQKFKEMLKNGDGYKIIKHPRRGQPTMKRLYSDTGLKKLLWDGRHGDGISLASVTAVRPGMTTSVFKKTGHVSQVDRCLSLITSGRSVDLETMSKEERDTLVQCFTNLVAEAQGIIIPTPAGTKATDNSTGKASAADTA